MIRVNHHDVLARIVCRELADCLLRPATAVVFIFFVAVEDASYNGADLDCHVNELDRDLDCHSSHCRGEVRANAELNLPADEDDGTAEVEKHKCG